MTAKSAIKSLGDRIVILQAELKEWQDLYEHPSTMRNASERIAALEARCRELEEQAKTVHVRAASIACAIDNERIADLEASLADETEAHDAWHKLCGEKNVRVEQLEAALRKYGRHDDHCQAIDILRHSSGDPCSCGFYAALTASETKVECRYPMSYGRLCEKYPDCECGSQANRTVKP